MKLFTSNPAMKAAMLLAYAPHEAASTTPHRELPKFTIPENVPDLFPEAELEQLVAENRQWIETIRTPIVRAVVAKNYITQWFDRNCVTSEATTDAADSEQAAVRPNRCSKKHERVFNEWDALERAYLQPCGFFDPAIESGGPPRKVDRMRARRSPNGKHKANSNRPNFGVPHELENEAKRQFLKDLKLQHYEQLTMQLDRETKLANELEDRTSEDYWDYFDGHQNEFKDNKEFLYKKRLDRKLKAAMPVQLKKSTGGEEDPHSPRLAIEFLMNQMRQYAKRYISMCPAQLRSKDHTTRIRKIRRGLDELAADMEVIKLEKFQRDLLKAPKDDSLDRIRGAPKINESDQLKTKKDPNQPLAGARGRLIEQRQEKDDSGNLLLDLLLRSNLKKNSKLNDDKQ